MMNISNSLSLLRMLLAIPIAWSIYADQKLILFLLVLLAVITDFLDGFLARKLNQISELGKILDPVADKSIVIIGTLAIIAKGLIPVWLSIAIISRDLLILIGGIWFKRKYRKTLTANMLGKITVNIVGLSLFLAVFYPKDWLLYIHYLSMLLLITSFISYFRRMLNIINQAGNGNF